MLRFLGLCLLVVVLAAHADAMRGTKRPAPPTPGERVVIDLCSSDEVVVEAVGASLGCWVSIISCLSPGGVHVVAPGADGEQTVSTSRGTKQT